MLCYGMVWYGMVRYAVVCYVILFIYINSYYTISIYMQFPIYLVYIISYSTYVHVLFDKRYP